MDSFNELWQVVSDYLKQTNSESIYNVWFSELEPISFDGSRAVLMTTAEFKRRILAQKFGGTLHSAFLNALGLDVDVDELLSIDDADAGFFRVRGIEKHALHGIALRPPLTRADFGVP